MTTMEQEALRRAQQMHSNTAAPPRPAQSPPYKSPPARSPGPPDKNPPVTKTKEEAPPLSTSPVSAVDSLFADKEKLLILLLIMILGTDENSDPTVTLALLYLII